MRSYHVIDCYIPQGRTHLHLSPLVLQQCECDSIDLNRDHLGNRDLPIPPGLILNIYSKGSQVLSFCDGCSQNIGAGSLEIKGHSIEWQIVGITRSRTWPTVNGVALLDSIQQLAFFVGSTREICADHNPTSLAHATLFASWVKSLTSQVVAVQVVAAALRNGDALVTTLHKVLITHTGFLALGLTRVRHIEAAACLSTAPRTEFILAIWRARKSCQYETMRKRRVINQWEKSARMPS